MMIPGISVSILRHPQQCIPASYVTSREHAGAVASMMKVSRPCRREKIFCAASSHAQFASTSSKSGMCFGVAMHYLTVTLLNGAELDPR